MALSSICEFSDYNGHILLISDRDAASLQDIVPKPLKSSLIYRTTSAFCRADFLTARYKIFNFAPIGYTHFLYMDCDVLMDRAVMSYLRRMHSLIGIGLVNEHPGKSMDEVLEYSDWFGGYLFERLSIPLKSRVCLNSGVMFIPICKNSKDMFEGIWYLFHSLYKNNSATLDAFGDQPVTSFYLQEYGLFHYEVPTKMVTLSRLSHINFDHVQTGFIHFNLGVADEEKIKLMSYYLKILKSKYKNGLLFIL